MSILRCDGCGELIDTDAHPEAFDEVSELWFCWDCFPDYDAMFIARARAGEERIRKVFGG